MDKHLTDTSFEFGEDLLNASRGEMYQALGLFRDHVKYTISLMMTLLTSVFAIFAFSQKEGIKVLAGQAQRVGGGILILLLPVSILSAFIISRYYRLYVSALMFSARLHHQKNLADTHPWFAENPGGIFSKGDRNLVSEKDVDPRRTMKWRTYGPTHTLFFYILLMLTIGGMAAYLGWPYFFG